MNSLALAAQKIKDSVSALDVGHAMGLEIRHGRCQCPIHGGKDFNCVLYKGNRGYYCHVCKSGGDVISFVQRYYNMSFKDSAKWFNDTFHLGMDIDSPLSPETVKQADFARKQREEERAFMEWKERMQFDLALTADRIVEMLEEQRDKNAPADPDGEWSEKFCEAIRLLPGARRFAQNCWFRNIKEEKR